MGERGYPDARPSQIVILSRRGEPARSLRRPPPGARAGGTGPILGPPPHAAHRPSGVNLRDVTFPAAPREAGSVGPTLAAGRPGARRGAAGRGRTRRRIRTAQEGLPSAAWP